jgi:hypothetical protein
VPKVFIELQKKLATDADERRVANTPGPKPTSRATRIIAGKKTTNGGREPNMASRA